MATSSKYADAAKRYDERTKFSGVSDKTLKFITNTKKEPKIYIQLLSEGLLAVPMHNFVEVKGSDGNTHKMSFVCQSLIDRPCYICDNGLAVDQYNKDGKPRKRMVGLAIQFEKSGKKYTPVREDIVVTPETGKRIAKKYPDLSPKIDEDRYTFTDMPKVGILDTNKSVDDGLALIMTETGSVNDCIFLIARTGEGLQTSYSAQRLSDSPIDFDEGDDELTQEVMASIEMSMSVDDYIDAYISEDRLKSAFGLDSDGSSKNRRSSDRDDEDEDVDDEDVDDDDDSDDDDDDDVDMDAMFAKSYRRGRRHDS